MRFFEALINEAHRSNNASVSRLILGWHASFAILDDGRWGIGVVPLSTTTILSSRAAHTRNLLHANAWEMAKLLVSPYPQEFAAASAAASALMPAPGGGLPPELLKNLSRRGPLGILGYDPEVIPLLRAWNMELTIFDNSRRGRDIYPEWSLAPLIRSCPWIWLTLDALRDRRIFEIVSELRTREGVILQGPGAPWAPECYREMGITHLLLPHLDAPPDKICSYIAAGGHPWMCRWLRWNLHEI